MLDERKAAILRVVVEEYIETAQPVGSAMVARLPELAVSSATVRNEMGVLEREGYLVQPHTSAGRIPTDRGYRFFVDSLTTPGTLQPAQSQQVRDFFAKAHGELEQMLHDTSRLLSNLTDCAAVVIAPSHEVGLDPLGPAGGPGPEGGPAGGRPLQRPGREVVPGPGLSRRATPSWRLRAPIFPPTWPAGRSGPILSCPRPATRRWTGCHRCRGASPWRTSTTAIPTRYSSAGRPAWSSAFDAVDTIRKVLDILEQQYVVVSLLQDVLDRGLSVAIGTEHGIKPLADCSVVVAPYQVEGEPAGTVGVLGPTRMHYEQALAAVAVVSKRLGKATFRGLRRRIGPKCPLRVTSTSCLASTATRPRTRSSGPTASWPASCIPTPIRAIRPPRSGSRRSPSPTRPCGTPSAGGGTTCSAPRRFGAPEPGRRPAIPSRIRRRRAGRPVRRLLRRVGAVRRRRRPGRPARPPSGRGRRGHPRPGLRRGGLRRREGAVGPAARSRARPAGARGPGRGPRRRRARAAAARRGPPGPPVDPRPDGHRQRLPPVRWHRRGDRQPVLRLPGRGAPDRRRSRSPSTCPPASTRDRPCG